MKVCFVYVIYIEFIAPSEVKFRTVDPLLRMESEEHRNFMTANQSLYESYRNKDRFANNFQ